jgi:pyridoxine 5-phosphate synthase
VLESAILRLRYAGARISLFIDPDEKQIRHAQELGAEFIELHTGAYANAQGQDRDRELQKLIAGAALAKDIGLRVNAGHGLNYTNTAPILALPGLEELNIGHSIISRSILVGLDSAVREMMAIIATA